MIGYAALAARAFAAAPERGTAQTADESASARGKSVTTAASSRDTSGRRIYVSIAEENTL